MKWFNIGILLSVCTAAQAEDAPDRRSLADNMIARAIHHDGRLWLLTDSGDLSSITDNASERVEESVPGPVLDICQSNRKLYALSCDTKACGNWRLNQQEQGQWRLLTSVASNGEQILALACDASSNQVLSAKRLIDLRGSRVSVTHLSEAISAPYVAASLVTPTAIFLGLNSGEWGGGLRRITRATGKVTNVEHLDGGLCSGPLSSDCDPVTGLAVIPWKPTCVAASIGIVHFAARGRIVEVCGQQVTTLLVKAYGDDDMWRFKDQDQDQDQDQDNEEKEPFPSVAFFGLNARGQSLLAVGIDGLYEINEDAPAKVFTLPEFREVDGVYLNDADPDTILVLTSINRRRSVSGAAPLFVRRGE
ncbi:hypothetical protein [Ahniella affigens]|nr:hypothetical protein [Ahniella affigens]